MVSTNNNEEIDLEESYEFDPYQLLTPWDDPEAERWRIPYLAEIISMPFRRAWFSQVEMDKIFIPIKSPQRDSECSER